MDFMNLFSKVGKEIIEEENEQESSFKESEELNAGLSVDDIAEIEDLKRSIVTLTKKISNEAISNELGIPLDKILDLSICKQFASISGFRRNMWRWQSHF